MRLETALGLTLQASKFLQAPTILELVDILDVELDKVKAELEAAALAGDLDEEGDAGGAGAGEDFVLNDRGIALLYEGAADMTTDAAREALEHRIVVEIAPAVTTEALTEALEVLNGRHAVLEVRLEGAKVTLNGEGIKLVTIDEALDPFQVAPIDVTAGEIARLTQAPAGEDATRLMLQVHSGVADRTAAYLLLNELLTMISGETLGEVIGDEELNAEMQRGVYDPEGMVNANDLAYWSYALNGPAREIAFKERARAVSIAALGRDHGLASEWFGDLPGTELTEADFVLALADALTEATEHDAGVFLTREADRSERLAGKPVVAPLSDDQPVYVPAGMSEEARRGHVERILAAADVHDSIDLYALRAELADQYAATGAKPFQIAYRFDRSMGALEGGLAAGPVSMGDYTVHAEPSGLSGIASDVEVVVRKQDGSTLLTVRVDSDVVMQEDAHRLMQALSGRLGLASVTSPYDAQLEVAE